MLKYIATMVSLRKGARKERDVTRIILMTLFFLFHFMLITQPPFRGEHGGRIPSDYSLIVALNIAITGFWLVLEVFEFLAWNYEWKNLRYGVAITVLRCIPALVLIVFYPELMPGMMRLMAPLLTFYLSLVFRHAWSYVVVAFFWLVQLLLFFTAPSSAEPPKSDNPYGIVILLYQLMSILLMFLFALFWKEDRKNRERQALLTAEIQANQEELKRYASRVSRVVALEERTRIARDIHDNLGHTLTAISIQLNKAEAFFRKDPEVSIKAIIDARTSMHEAMLDIRSTLDTLNNQAEGFDLVSQVQRPLESLRQAGISVVSDIRGSTEGYNVAVLLALYRFVQEGVTNILKHAEAHEVNLEIRMDGDQACAELRDDGVGFDPNAMKKRNNDVVGYGLTGLTDRINLVRGTFSVESSPGKGTILRARMPKDPVALIGKERDDVARE